MTRSDTITTIEGYMGRYAEQAESWKEDHDEVMRNHEIADALCDAAQRGVLLLDLLKHVKTSVFEDAKWLYDSYAAWYRHSLLLVRAIEDSEHRGFEVEYGIELKAAFKSVSMVIGKVQGRRKALDAFINGKGVPADEFIAHLRNRNSS